MGASLAGALVVGGVALVVEMLVWDTAFNPDEILKREVERVYGISFGKGDSSDFSRDTPALGTDADGNKVIIRYNSETNEIETVDTWVTIEVE